jgi:hypothetical protein
MRVLGTIGIIMAALASAQTHPDTAAKVQPSDMESYSNGRFGYTVNYPKSLVAKGESDNGDGQRFESKDKKFTMAVWGEYNALENSVSAECEQRIKGEQEDHPFTPSYKVTKSTWYAFSGIVGSTIIYQKAILQDDSFKTLRLEYPVAEKEALDPVVKRIVASFQSFKTE